MERKALKDLGLTDAQIESVMALHGKAFEGYLSKEESQLKTGEIQTLTATVKERDAQLEALKKSAGSTDELKAEIAKLQGENKTAADTYAAQLKAEREARLLDTAIMKHSPVSLAAVKAVVDGAKLKYTDSGVDGLEEQLSAIKQDKELGVLFKRGEQKPPIQFGAGQNNGGKREEDAFTLESAIEAELAKTYKQQ